jgi:hypothetical protein
MGNDSKLVVIDLFVTTIVEEEKCDNNKLVVITHFHFKHKEEEKWAIVTSLLLSPYSQ